MKPHFPRDFSAERPLYGDRLMAPELVCRSLVPYLTKLDEDLRQCTEKCKSKVVFVGSERYALKPEEWHDLLRRGG